MTVVTDTKVCERCGEEFARKKRISNRCWERRRFCTRACFEAGGRQNICVDCGGPRHKGQSYCLPCYRQRLKRWRQENPEKRREYTLSRASTHGKRPRVRITADDYARWCEEQGGRCAICGLPEGHNRNGVLDCDHDHVTGQIRGLLCTRCNTGLGLFKDDPERLRQAVLYLGHLV